MLASSGALMGSTWANSPMRTEEAGTKALAILSSGSTSPSMNALELQA